MKRYGKEAIFIGVLTIALFLCIEKYVTSVHAESDPFTEQMQEWEEQGIDPNHTEVVEAVRGYIDKHINDDVFASLHIDREEKELGIIVLSFTEDIAKHHKQALKALETEQSKISFREVEYTEDELISKQAEIDFHAFENEGIKIYHTGIDVIGNQVEIGISPYNEENAEIVYDRYGTDMITVVEGAQATAEAAVDTAQQIEEKQNDTELQTEDEDNKNGFQKFFSSIIQWFSNLFT